MQAARDWNGRDGLPVEIPSTFASVNAPAPALTAADRWAIRRRGAITLRRIGWTRREIAALMGISRHGVKQLLRRTRRLGDRVIRSAQNNADADSLDN